LIRISFTIEPELADRLRAYANIFATGDEAQNVSKVLNGLIEKHIPILAE